jgi:serine/threonine protein kinase
MGYLSPEIVASAHYTHKTDIWAAGVILSEMVQGRSFLDKMSDK